VGDNLDMNTRPRSETLSHHADSKQFFHIFAVKDRINNGKFDDTTKSVDIASVDVRSILPTTDDSSATKKNLGVLAFRLVRKNYESTLIQ